MCRLSSLVEYSVALAASALVDFISFKGREI